MLLQLIPLMLRSMIIAAIAQMATPYLFAPLRRAAMYVAVMRAYACRA
jgi:hypothetical protein